MGKAGVPDSWSCNKNAASILNSVLVRYVAWVSGTLRMAAVARRYGVAAQPVLAV